MNADTLKLQSTQTTEPMPLIAQRFDLPFIGFYESFHMAEADNIIIIDIENAGDDLDAPTKDLIMENHYNKTDWAGYRAAIAKDYAEWLIFEVIEKLPAMRVNLYSPSQYNFVSDTIEVAFAEPLPQLTLSYFQANGLMDDVRKAICDTHTSREGYISFVNPNPADDEIFTEPHYLTQAFWVLACHAFDIDPNDCAALSEIDDKFIAYALARNIYDIAYYANHHSGNEELMGYK